MSFELITYEVKGRIGLITLNRPKVLNALNGALMEELNRAMGEAAVDFLIDFIHGLDDAPMSNVSGGLDLARSLRASPPEDGGSFGDVFPDFKAAASAASGNTVQPRSLSAARIGRANRISSAE